MDTELEYDSRVLFSGLSVLDRPGEDDGALREAALDSPFATRSSFDRAEADAGEASDFVAELEDEEFAESLEQIADDAAAQVVGRRAPSSAFESEYDGVMHLEQWIEPTAAAGENAVEDFSQRVGAVDLYTMPDHELERFLDLAGADSLQGLEGYEAFLGGIIRAAKKVVGGAVNAVKKGVAAVGKILPIGIILNKLKGMVRPLLKRIVKWALGKLPANLRPLATQLAGKIGVPVTEAEFGDESGDSGERFARLFELEVASLLYAPDSTAEWENEDVGEDYAEAPDPLAELDQARAVLAERLSALPDGARPVAEIEQFLPAVLAIKPLVKMGISIIGRQRVIGTVRDVIASLASPLIGAQGAKLIAGPLANLGFTALGLEDSPASQRELAGEAVASTIEGAVIRLLESPPEVFEDQLQLTAAAQGAFTEAAAAYLPDGVLRPGLPELETSGDGGVWVLMPRAARPRYRFRRFSRVYRVPVTRQMARAVPWSDGGTLETHLLDRGLRSWPLEAEVDLFEAMPGTMFGHFEGEDEGDEAGEDAQPLTPEIAGLLLREPALGRAVKAPLVGRARPVPAQRFYSLRSPALARRRPARRIRRRILLVVEPSRRRVRLRLRLSERQAQQLSALLQPASPSARRDLAGALGQVKAAYGAKLPAVVAERLLKHSLVSGPADATAVAGRMVAALSAALSAYLTQHSPQFVAAVADRDDGVVFDVTFAEVTREKLAGAIAPPEVSVSPGWGSPARKNSDGR